MSIEITQAAIEAGARAIREMLGSDSPFPSVTVAGVAIKAALPHLQPQASPPAPDVAGEDAEVERVARAAYEASYDRPAAIKWDELTEYTKTQWRRIARAAIRAIRDGGQRWGVEATGPDKKKCWALGQDPAKEFSTHDKEAADLVCGLLTQLVGWSNVFTYEVLPYPGEREKTAEWEEAMKAAEEVYPTNETYTRGELLMRFARKFAAIRDAKGGK